MERTARLLLSMALLASASRPASETASPSVAPTGPAREAGLRKACEGGDTGKCVELGALERERGNHARASALWRKACEGGDTTGCASLGTVAMEAGDTAEAAKFFRRACDGKDMNGCLGLMVLEMKKERAAEGR